ncbi:MAG: hypothetical protein DCC65_05265 [Planctomycetota bacterium]|nr:MAG: hypothetical protein DCC65_05265 [Planctomycetota bacterium]
MGMRATSLISRAGMMLADLILPRTCAACGASIDLSDKDLCETCARQLAAGAGGSYCRTCGEDRGEHLLHDGRCTRCVLGKSLRRFHGFARVGKYDGVLKSLILRFKTSFVLDRLLGDLLASAILGMMDVRAVDCWVPIPSHWTRRVSTLYQPTDLLARAAVRAWGGRVEPVLKMSGIVRPFHMQPGLSAKERAEQIRGKMQMRRAADVQGLHICLIDDVMTTGATIGEASRVLRDAGAAAISVAVLARAGGNEPVHPGVDPAGKAA